MFVRQIVLFCRPSCVYETHFELECFLSSFFSICDQISNIWELSWSPPSSLYVYQDEVVLNPNPKNGDAVIGAPFLSSTEIYLFLCRDGKVEMDRRRITCRKNLFGEKKIFSFSTALAETLIIYSDNKTKRSLTSTLLFEF